MSEAVSIDEEVDVVVAEKARNAGSDAPSMLPGRDWSGLIETEDVGVAAVELPSLSPPRSSSTCGTNEEARRVYEC